MGNTSFLCVTCGTEYPPSTNPPDSCPICLDERQYVGLDGQQWTTLDDLRREHKNEFVSLEPHLTAIRTQPSFGINQRALFLETAEGNVLWDCIALLDPETKKFIDDRGGLKAVAISHPHYYTTMGAWSEAFGNVPVYLHQADRQHVGNPSRGNLHFWSGETLPLLANLTLIRGGGHFEGGAMLHWPDGGDGKGALLSGDIIQVVPDRRWVSFMYSYPNLIPLSEKQVRFLVTSIEAFEFDRVYGAFHPMQVMSDGKNAISRSAERYIRAIQ
jgi:hypothetical protein